VGGRLAGLRALVAENEFLIADDIARILTGQGCTVVGPVRRVERALALLDADATDIALLEVKLDGRSAAPLAAALRARGVPFVLVTGYAEPPEPVFQRAPRVAKPFRDEELLGAVAQTIRAHA
jgi:two-component SAPR family response regulator